MKAAALVLVTVVGIVLVMAYSAFTVGYYAGGGNGSGLEWLAAYLAAPLTGLTTGWVLGRRRQSSGHGDSPVQDL